MFSTITWSEFLVIAAIAAAVYYAIILFIYYRKDIFKRFSAKPSESRRNLSIPVTNGVMGSVLFDDDDLTPESPQATTKEKASTTEEEEDPFEADDDFDDEAEQARQYALLDELVSRLTDIISSKHRLPTPEVLDLLKEQIQAAEPSVYQPFKEAITEDLINKFYEYRGTRLTTLDLRPIWP